MKSKKMDEARFYARQGDNEWFLLGKSTFRWKPKGTEERE